MTTGRSSRRPARLVAVALLWPLLVGAAPVDRELEARMLAIASGLRCPVCQNLSVADSTSDLAREMRALIVDELRAGRSAEEIRAYFVSKYGQWILLAPTPSGVGLLVWVLPGLGALAGLGGAVWALRRWARRGPAVAPAPLADDDLTRLRTLMAAGALPAGLTEAAARELAGLGELEFDHRAGKLSDRDYGELRALYEGRAAAALAAAEAERAHAGAERSRAAAAADARETAEPAPRARRWRWAAAALFLVAFGGALGYTLPGALRPRGEDGSLAGDPLTGTGRASAPADVPGLVAEGRRALAAQDFRRAIAMFSRALALDPDQPAAHAYMGLILLQAGHPERALASFDRALARDARLVPALWGKGLVLDEAQGRTGEAIGVWETLLTLDLSGEDREHVTRVLAEARARLARQEAPAAAAPNTGLENTSPKNTSPKNPGRRSEP